MSAPKVAPPKQEYLPDSAHCRGAGSEPEADAQELHPLEQPGEVPDEAHEAQYQSEQYHHTAEGHFHALLYDALPHDPQQLAALHQQLQAQLQEAAEAAEHEEQQLQHPDAQQEAHAHAAELQPPHEAASAPLTFGQLLGEAVGPLSQPLSQQLAQLQHLQQSHLPAAYPLCSGAEAWQHLAAGGAALLPPYGEPQEGPEAGKPEIVSVDETAAAHLAALRNTGLQPGEQLGEGQGDALAEGQLGLAQQMHLHPVGAYLTPQLPATGAAPPPAGSRGTKRRGWRSSHSGVDSAEAGEAGGPRQRRKQTRRPDRLCHHEGCYVTPTYNFPGEKKRVFCVSHKQEGMVNVVAKRCEHPDCGVNPRFNFESEARGRFCSEHKLEGMVNVIDRRCQEPGCKKFPSHNFPGEHKKLFCATHKQEGMVDMSHGSTA